MQVQCVLGLAKHTESLLSNLITVVNSATHFFTEEFCWLYEVQLQDYKRVQENPSHNNGSNSGIQLLKTQI